MISDQNKLSLELYKELGREVRAFNSEVYATNRLMLPPLVVGLLILYGKVEKFLGVEFQNAEAVHWLIWLGCVIISLIWICNVSRLSQLVHLHRQTIRQCEHQLGLKGHRKIFEMDEKSVMSKILRHSTLRFIGFGIYFSLLLNFLPRSIFAYEELILWISIGIGVGLAVGSRYLYLKKPFRTSSTPPIKWRRIVSIVLLILLVRLIFFSTVLFLENLQKQPDANVHLMRGLKHYAIGDYDNAIQEYTKAIEIKPDYAKAYALRGETHRANGKDDQSNKDWDMVKALREGQ